MKISNKEIIEIEHATNRAVRALQCFANTDDHVTLGKLESLVAEVRHFALCISRDRFPDEDEQEYQDAYEAALERFAKIFIN